MKGVAVSTAVAVIALSLLLSASAVAEPAGYSHTTRVSGADAALVALRSVRHIEIGSRAFTVTLDLDGRRLPLTLGHGELTRGALGENGSPGLTPMLMAAVCLGQVLRLLDGTRRLARRRV